MARIGSVRLSENHSLQGRRRPREGKLRQDNVGQVTTGIRPAGWPPSQLLTDLTKRQLINSCTMVGVAGENCAGPVELFQEHDTNELVRPSRRAEGEHAGGAGVQGLGKAVGAADNEAGRRTVLLAPLPQESGEPGAVEILSSLVENGDDGLFGDDVGDRDRFLGTAPLGFARAALADFDDFDFAKAERPSDSRRAFAIGSGEFAFRALFKAPNGGNQHTQSKAP